MTVYVKVGGIWETVTEVYVKQSGVWAQPKNLWIHQDIPPQQPQNLTTGTCYGRVFTGGAYPFSYTWGPANAVWYDGTFANRPYLQPFFESQFYAETLPFWEYPPAYPLNFPSTVVGKIVVPYSCNRAAFRIQAQGGAGAASTTNFAAGAGGGGAVLNYEPISGGFVVNEFDEFTVTITAENDTTTSGDGADGSSYTVSWPGNTITADGGKGGIASCVNGVGGVASGSGPIWNDLLLSGVAANGFAGTTNAYGLNKGGNGAVDPFQPFIQGVGGSLFGEFDDGGFCFAIDPVNGGGGGGGYNSWGQKGGDSEILFSFWRD
jgi:hypothetical protein